MNGIEEARGRLPLRRFMEQNGDGVNPNKKSGLECPFCRKKKATMKEFKGREWFKCWNTECPSGTSGAKGAWDEVGYLAFRRGLDRKEAFIVYLKEAGVWKENH